MFSEIFDAINRKFPNRKVSGFEDLNEQEKVIYNAWAVILNKPDPTIDDLKKLLPAELERARKEQNAYENTEKKDLFFKAYIRLLETVTAMIVSPQQEREALKERLRKQFNI